jgi:flavorubredoxin
VKNADSISLGQKTLTFLETRMLHWPDSMFTYLNEDQILFSSDAFGQHYAGQEKFDDQVGEAIMAHAQKYYANILLLYAPLILKLIDKVKAMGLGIRMICPDHGILWRTDPAKIVSAYARWSRQETANKAVVVYDTMWNSTRQMAEAIVDGLADAGAMVKPMPLRAFDRSDIMTEVLDARAVVVGSPTLNNGLFPTVADFLCYMKGLKPQNRIGAAFGSYGWSGEAVKQIESVFKEMAFTLVEPGLRHQYVPGAEGLEGCRDFGRKIATAMAKG